MLRSFQKICPSPRYCVTFCNMLIFFYGAEVLSPRSTTYLEDHPSSVLRHCSLHIFPIIRHNRSNTFTPSLFIGTITNIMKIIKRLYRCSVMSVHSVLSLHAQCYCQCHNTDNKQWPQTALQSVPTKPLHSPLFTEVQNLLNYDLYYKEQSVQLYSYKIRTVQATCGTNTPSFCVAYGSDANQHDTFKHDE